MAASKIWHEHVQKELKFMVPREEFMSGDNVAINEREFRSQRIRLMFRSLSVFSLL